MNTTTTKTALITGASRGLGLALARALAERGVHLIINARGATALEEVRLELAQKTLVTAVVGDIAAAPTIRALTEAAGATRLTGGLSAVVNNASVLGPSPRPGLLDYPLDQLATVFQVNTVAPLALLQSLRSLIRPGGCVLNITSDAGYEAYEGWGGYGASKAALAQISAVLAAEEPQWRVYWVDPGDMRTQMHQEAFPGEDISDRPPPEASVPGLLALIEGDYPSGRYHAPSLQTDTSNKP